MSADRDPDGTDERLLKAVELEGLLYMAVHDLKAPLRAVNSLAQCIESDLGPGVSAATHEDLALLRARVRRMSRLLEALQEYAKAGRDDSVSEDVDLNVLAKELAAGLPVLPGQRVLVEPGLPCLRAPREPLRQVLFHLMDNALRHHDKADGMVELSARTGKDRVQITVRDNGPGIAPQHQERILKIFQTMKAKDEVEGSGVGLAIVEKILQRNGATLSLVSAPGQGSAFTVVWPQSVETAHP